MQILLIIVGLVIVGVIWFIVSRNKIIALRSLVDEAWSGVDVQLKKRHDLVGQLVESVKGYAKHEKTLLETVTALRTAATSSKSLSDQGVQEQKLARAVPSIIAVAEAYPDLKASSNFIELQKSLTAVENDLHHARRYYNGTVRNFNTYIAQFPASIVASITHVVAKEFFQVSDSEREVVKISQ